MNQDDDDDIVKLFTIQEMTQFASAMTSAYADGPIDINEHDLIAWVANRAVGIEINKSDLERTIQLLVSLENAK